MLLLKGPNLFLRRIELSDVDARYERWLNDPEVTRYLEVRFAPQTQGDIKAFVESKLDRDDEILMAICLNETKEHIGNIKLGPINVHHKSADISLFIGEKPQWGKGYAAEAIGLVTNYAFKTLRLNKLKAGCYGANEGSAKAFERCGFLREGLLRDQVFCEGKTMDVVLLGLSARDRDV